MVNSDKGKLVKERSMRGFRDSGEKRGVSAGGKDSTDFPVFFWGKKMRWEGLA